MSFFPGGFNNAGFYTVTPVDLAVVEGFQDVFAAVIDITFTTADLAAVDTNDTAAFAASVITSADLAVVGPVDDVGIFGLVIADILDFTVNEANDVTAFVGAVATSADLDVDDVTDNDDFNLVVATPATLAVTDVPDEYDGRAFVGYFFLAEQEILYVSSENTTMTIPYNTNRIRIAAKPEPLERLPIDTSMSTKKRNRSKVT